MKKVIVSVLILLLIVSFVVPACSSSTDEAKLAYCQSLETLAIAAVNVKSINASTSVDLARQYLQAFQSAWIDSQYAKGDLVYAKFGDLQSAYYQLTSSLNSISGSLTVAQAGPSIQAAMTAFEAQLNALRGNLCTVTYTKTQTSSP